MPSNSKDYNSNNRTILVRGGKSYFDHLQQLIESAEETLYLQTYIFEDDKTGLMIGDALIRAAQRGVKVFLMVDGYASQGLDGDFILALKEKGIQFRYFEPLFRSRRFYLGRRLHHKVCVSDMRFALVGGVNVANHYNDLPESPAWLDFALHVEGEIVKELLVLCQKTWNGFRPLSKIPKMMDAPMFSFPENAKVKMRMRRNDWVRRKSQISSSYLEMLRNAKSEIYILSSYFLPGSIFRKALRQAAERGVKISVILAGTSDVKIAKLAERYMYEWLLSRGITIMEYNPTVLHGKLAICDGKWLTLGSFNVNDISTYASVELNLDVADPRFVREVLGYLRANVMNHCTVVSESYMEGRSSLLRRWMRWGAFVTTRFLFFFFTFYFQQVQETSD